MSSMMADKAAVNSVARRGHSNQDKRSIHNDSMKSSEEERLLKERLLDEKMKLIRQKNEERLRRQKEIEDDIRNAATHSYQTTEEKPAYEEHKMAGVREEKPSVTKMRGRARGRILAKMAQEELQAHRFENKRKQNYKLVEKEMHEEKSKNSSPPRGSSFLADDHRVDMSKVASRSSYSWGGSQFEDVVEKVNKEYSKPRCENPNIEVTMTGKERKEYLQWKDERNRIDRERKLRQKSGETWQREWDKCKVSNGANPIHERHEQQNKRRSGQRFWERTRQKPDWDLHDDRVDDTEQDLHHGSDDKKSEKDDWEEINDEKESTFGDVLSKDVQDISSTGLQRQVEPSSQKDDIVTTNLDSCTTKVGRKEEVMRSEETNVIADDQTTNSDKQDHTSDKADSNERQEISCETAELRIEETAKTSVIKNLTVTINSDGKRNITDDPTNNNTNSYLDEKKETVSNDKQCEVKTVKQNEIIEQPKPQRVHKKHRHRKEKEVQHKNIQEKEDLNEEMVQNTHSLLKDQVDTNDANDMTISHQETSKENLPKLEIKKPDEEEETVPDFLKTPQKKDWADYEFDEELELLPLEWDSLPH